MSKNKFKSYIQKINIFGFPKTHHTKDFFEKYQSCYGGLILLPPCI